MFLSETFTKFIKIFMDPRTGGLFWRAFGVQLGSYPPEIFAYVTTLSRGRHLIGQRHGYPHWLHFHLTTNYFHCDLFFAHG